MADLARLTVLAVAVVLVLSEVMVAPPLVEMVALVYLLL